MPPGRPAKKKAPIPEGEYKISSGETLDGKDYFDFMFEIEQIRSDPIYFIEDILGFPGPDEFGIPRKMWPMQRQIIHDFYSHKYDSFLEPIKKLALVLGQRAGKTTLTSTIMAYELVEVISWENPAKHFGLMTGKSGKGSTIALTCLCPSMKQAQDGVFASMKALIEGNEWFQLNFPDLTIDASRMFEPNKNVIAQVMAAKASTLAGYTNKIVIFDEYDYFPDSDKLIDSEAVFTKLANSTETFGRDGKIVAISSLKTQNGRMMAVYNQFKRQEKNRLARAYMYKTWEVNPLVTQEYLLETCEGDRARFYRDFANEPQLSSGLMFPEGIKLDKTLLNVLDSDYSTLPAAIRSIPRVMSIDPAYKNDSFGISVAYKHINQQTAEETVIVDGVKSFRKMGDANALILPSDIRAFIGNTMKNLNIYAFLYDIHMYPEILETVEYEYGVEPLKHIVIKEDYDRWRELQEGLSSTKLRVVYNDDLQAEAEQLYIKIMQGGNAKVEHPWSGAKDISDTVANCIWYLESDDAIDYTGMTTIGCVGSCMGGEVDIYCDYDDEYTDYFC